MRKSRSSAPAAKISGSLPDGFRDNKQRFPICQIRAFLLSLDKAIRAISQQDTPPGFRAWQRIIKRMNPP